MTRMTMQGPFWLSPQDQTHFPDVELAMTDPNGLLAVGGDLSTPRLLAAYRAGIFPWYSTGQPILWWSPNPRAVLYLDPLKVSRSLKKSIRKHSYELRLDTAFADVVSACAVARGPATGTWITDEMAAAYLRLHHEGHAHSVEVWSNMDLVGGLYGVSIGKVFFGESMFSRATDTSKIALTALVKYLQQFDFALIDCQVASSHLFSLGAVTIPRKTFVQQITAACKQQPAANIWTRFISREELLSRL